METFILGLLNSNINKNIIVISRSKISKVISNIKNKRSVKIIKITIKSILLFNLFKYLKKFSNQSAFKFSYKKVMNSPFINDFSIAILYYSTPLELKVLTPVNKKIKKNGISYIEFVLTEQMQNYFDKNGKTYNTLIKYKSKEIDKKAKKQTKEIIKHDLHDIINYENLYIREVIRKKLRLELKKSFGFFKHYLSIKEMLLKNQVKMVLMAQDNLYLGRLFCFAAQELGIPSLVIQHSTGSGGEEYLISNAKIFADKMAIAGENQKSRFIRHNIPESKFFITGVPFFDEVIKNEKLNSSDIDYLKSIGINPDYKYIIYATQPRNEVQNSDKIFKLILESFMELDGINLIVKVHPREDENHYKTMVKKTGKSNIFVLKEESLYPLIKISDILITYYSATSFEGLLLDTKVIFINIFHEKLKTLMIDNDVARQVSSKDELSDVISEYYNNGEWIADYQEKRKNFLLKELFSFDNNSAQRVMDYILRKINNK